MKFEPNKDRDAFLFYASTLDILETFPEERQGQLALTILDFAFRDDVTAPFDCSEDVWLSLNHVFEGIIKQKERYRNEKLLANVIRLAEGLTIVDKDSAKQDKLRAELSDIIAKLKKVKWRASKNPESFNKEDVISILGKFYPLLAPKGLLRLSLLDISQLIKDAPTSTREKLQNELKDIAEYCLTIYPDRSIPGPIQDVPVQVNGITSVRRGKVPWDLTPD